MDATYIFIVFRLVRDIAVNHKATYFIGEYEMYNLRKPLISYYSLIRTIYYLFKAYKK